MSASAKKLALAEKDKTVSLLAKSVLAHMGKAAAFSYFGGGGFLLSSFKPRLYWLVRGVGVGGDGGYGKSTKVLLREDRWRCPTFPVKK